MHFGRMMFVGLMAALIVAASWIVGKEETVHAELGDGTYVMWDAIFRVENHQAIVTKQVTVWDKIHTSPSTPPYWDRILYEEIDIECVPNEPDLVTVRSDHIVFGRGGHLICFDIDLATFLQEAGHHPDDIKTLNRCSYNADLYCMHSPHVEFEAEVETSDMDGVYPIFSYPQAYQGRPTKYLEFKTQVDTNNQTQAIDWRVHGFTFTSPQQPIFITEVVGHFWPITPPNNLDPEENWYNLEVRQIPIPEAAGRYFEYRVDHISQGYSDLREEWYEFPAHEDVIFYLGDRVGEIPEDGAIKIQMALPDPISVCGSCD